MPKISKQSSSKKRKSKGVVGRIAPVSFGTGKDKINVYGVSGTGKTTFACTYPKPLLIVGCEDGTRSVYDIKGVDFVRIQRCEELDELVEYTRKTNKYKSFVLDTVTSFQQLSIAEIADLIDTPVQLSWGLASQSQWGQCAMQVKEYLRRVLRLAEDGICHAIILAQERTFIPKEPLEEELIKPAIMSALTASTVGWLNPECDYIVQTFIRQATVTKTIEIAGKKREVSSKTANIEYCLRTRAHSVYTVKFRGPKGTELPEYITDPDYKKVHKLIGR